MKTTKVYNTLEELHADAGTHQLTAQELLNGRAHLSGQWGPVTLSDELREQICRRLADIFGGRQETKDRVYRHLMNERRQNWGLSRVFVEKFREAPAQLHYCAGQDMPTEIAQIRKELK